MYFVPTTEIFRMMPVKDIGNIGHVYPVSPASMDPYYSISPSAGEKLKDITT
jgi:hypothetical protein